MMCKERRKKAHRNEGGEKRVCKNTQMLKYFTIQKGSDLITNAHQTFPWHDNVQMFCYEEKNCQPPNAWERRVKLKWICIHMLNMSFSEMCVRAKMEMVKIQTHKRPTIIIGKNGKAAEKIHSPEKVSRRKSDEIMIANAIEYENVFGLICMWKKGSERRVESSGSMESLSLSSHIIKRLSLFLLTGARPPINCNIYFGLQSKIM